ncbi:hypothetical protein ScPMuIL_000380 [Solemya velum]
MNRLTCEITKLSLSVLKYSAVVLFLVSAVHCSTHEQEVERSCSLMLDACLDACPSIAAGCSLECDRNHERCMRKLDLLSGLSAPYHEARYLMEDIVDRMRFDRMKSLRREERTEAEEDEGYAGDEYDPQ